MDKDKFWAELEALGEEQVRQNVATRGHYGEKKQNSAVVWLEMLDRQKLNKIPWHKTWWGKVILAVLAIVLAATVIGALGLG